MTSRVVVTGGRVMAPDRVIPDGRVVIDGGSIVAVEPASPAGSAGTVVDAGGGWIVPGFIDLQVNGGAGVDITNEPERMDGLGRDLIRQGVTAYLPTVITAPARRRAAALRAWAERSPVTGGARPLGLHFEGPMISRSRLGAHPGEHVVDPAPPVIAGWSRDAGVAMVTLAPERPGALGVIAALIERGIVVAIGHTDATAAEVDQAVAAGATYVTHLFNAMRPFGHRDPGPIGATLGGDGVVAGLIVDGLHADAAAVRLAWRALGPDRFNLVTDAVAARGATGASSALGSVDVTAAPDGGVRTSTGVLAGSTLTLDVAVRNLVAMTGASVPDAVRTVTATPARVLGLCDRGTLAPGGRGDVAVLDDALAVRTVVVAGRLAWSSGRA